LPLLLLCYILFCVQAIKVVMLAQEEARRLGHNFVGTEQILLGLIGESTGIAAKVLKSMGVNLKDARVEVEKIIGRGSGFVAVEIPFTPRAKRVLELSLEEARQLGKLSFVIHHKLSAFPMLSAYSNWPRFDCISPLLLGAAAADC
jgi:ATP-dependent Clp protease ATP-binding subunit ClpA